MLFLGCWSVIPRCFIFPSDLKDGDARPWCGGGFSCWKGTLAVRENGWKASTSGQESSCSMAAFVAMVASILALLVCFGGQKF